MGNQAKRPKEDHLTTQALFGLQRPDEPHSLQPGDMLHITFGISGVRSGVIFARRQRMCPVISGHRFKSICLGSTNIPGRRWRWERGSS